MGTWPAGPFEALGAVVDTGAFYTWVPSSVLAHLGIVPHDRRSFLLADGRTLERDVGYAVVRIDGREVITLVVFGDEGTEPLLGAYTLEGLALAADPVNQRLVPIPGCICSGRPEISMQLSRFHGLLL